jgi:hypothetical protein
VLEIPVAAAADNAAPPTDKIYGGKCFWTQSLKKHLLVFATQFRKGRHFLQRPKNFLSIIEHLEKLHGAGCVFPKEEGGPGFLIDFDFSGKVVDTVYPKGYNRNSDDGYRIGSYY